ncbi:hypothetical protein ScPMuIL_011853 [Solemya velum]
MCRVIKDSEEYRLRTARYLDQLNYKLTLNESKSTATVEGPGLTHDDYNMNGTPKPWKLLMVIESALFYAHRHPFDEDGQTFRRLHCRHADSRTFRLLMSSM